MRRITDAPPVRPTSTRRERRPRWGYALLLAVVLGWAVHGTGLSVSALAEGGGGALLLLEGFLSPNLSGAFLSDVAGALVETVQISLTGLLFAALLGLPLAVLIAGNVEAVPALRAAARTTAATLRGVPDLLWALLFVAMLGPGAAAGSLALAVHGAGLLAKLCAEQFEAVDPGPVEALRLTGSGRMATTALAVVPQAAPGLASLLLYQWECNLRTSTVLGFVGAGGIGQELAVSLKLFRYDELSTLVIAVLAVILVVDLASRTIRRRLGAAA
ncbi:phosphonate ABC transporter, permease protein PhnE [Nonomuraea basaltis]|uniref:phosphonate ABC transporter, permease protein PhnE n=1 Tax=Nonomuraea basaltis TaxID=2495887 RepID=UPI00110C6141|nr:phosphonate ABC transporter, permease protein PhnE [Nonomuraea basaltis]TMR98927.1 phosphonate ABC transporter, permease protein PhnE [Nonomuraea basaltis]